MTETIQCPCHSTKTLNECCAPFIEGQKLPATPEELMRSRYTAFCFKNMDYLETTTDPENMESFDREANEDWASKAKFLKLEIKKTDIKEDLGMVEFVAHFNIDGEDSLHHEHSKFIKKADKWFFHSGEIDEENGYFYEVEEE